MTAPRQPFLITDFPRIKAYRALNPPTPWAEIARLMNRCSPVALAQYYNRTVRKQESAPKNLTPTTTRRCMGRGCGKPFASHGAHHRMCDRCREQTAGPYDNFYA